MPAALGGGRVPPPGAAKGPRFWWFGAGAALALTGLGMVVAGCGR